MIQEMLEAGAIDLLDLHFARAIGRLAGSTNPAVLAGAALANRAPTHGHVCCRLNEVERILKRELGLDRDEVSDRPPLPELPKPGAWEAALKAVPRAIRMAREDRPTPLVLDDGALYLDRYWRYEDQFTRAVLSRIAHPVTDLDPAEVRAGLDLLFTDPRTKLQRLAVKTALLNRFAVVSGGPGTGKTAVVVKLLALLNRVAVNRGEPVPRVMLVAPTGKAAARLSESIRSKMSDPFWVPTEMQQDITAMSSTIHSALGVIRIDVPRFRHNADNPLPIDVLVVDEASMVDMPLMAKLVDAVPTDARLILLGDPDQLVSVEMGSVLGDVCKAHLDGVHVHLEYTWRYPQNSGIKALAEAIQDNDGERVVALLDSDEYPDISRLEPPKSVRGFEALLRNRLVARYSAAVTATDPKEALEALGSFRILCAHRRGVRGVERLNWDVEGWLVDEKKIRLDQIWYAGRPVMVTRNDPALNLRNGDVGIVLEGDTPGSRVAWFPGATDGELREFRPSALPEHATVYATTVHKGQGSEYEDVLVILPDKRSPVVTRELLYTAVTRASRSVTVLGSAEVIALAVGVTIERMTGLQAKLGRRS